MSSHIIDEIVDHLDFITVTTINPDIYYSINKLRVRNCQELSWSIRIKYHLISSTAENSFKSFLTYSGSLKHFQTAVEPSYNRLQIVANHFD